MIRRINPMVFAGQMHVTTRRAFLLFALSAIAACASVSQTSPAAVEPLRAMTFNIRYGTAPDGENAWSRRRALAIRVIAAFDPAVLGTQEALRFQLDEIRHALPAYGEVGVGRDDGRSQGEYSAILYDRGRLEVLDQGTFWLSDTPESAGSKSWGNRYPRIVTWARFRDRSDRSTFYVYNTHFDHESQPARERSAQLMLARMAHRTHRQDPVILMGDFNAGEDNPALRALLAPGNPVPLSDTFRTMHPHAMSVGTYHAFTGDRNGAKIDAILASQEWEVMTAAIVHDAEQGRYPSDHFPVTATLRRPARR